MTEQEKQEIIDAAVEKAMLMLPQVIGNLMAQMATYSKINEKFYKDHPEFKSHTDVVASIVEQIDGANPALTLEQKLERSVPEIKKRLSMMKKLDMTGVSDKPNRDMSNGEF